MQKQRSTTGITFRSMKITFLWTRSAIYLRLVEMELTAGTNSSMLSIWRLLMKTQKTLESIKFGAVCSPALSRGNQRLRKMQALHSRTETMH